jgi:hypothetical protein
MKKMKNSKINKKFLTKKFSKKKLKILTENLSQKIYHKKFITKNLSQKIYHKKFITKNLSQKISHKKFLTISQKISHNITKNFSQYQKMKMYPLLRRNPHP